MAVLATPPVPVKLYRSLWENSGWEPHDIQREILLDGTRNKVVALGRRAGKSQTGGRRLVPEAFRTWYQLEKLHEISQRREYWIVGPEYSDAEKEFRVAWNELTRLGFEFDKPGSYNNPESGEMVISMFNRRLIIHAKSAKYPTTLVGEGLSGVIMAEAAKMKPSVWYKFIRPTLADFDGWSMFNSTPEGKNWFYDLYMLGLDERFPSWRSWRAPSWVNHHVYPGGANEEFLNKCIEARRKHKLDFLLKLYKVFSRHGKTHFERENSLGINQKVHRDRKTGEVIVNDEIWAMFLEMSQELFNQEIAALFTEYVGRVFKDFDEEIHVVPQEYNPAWTTYACVDYGFRDPFVWLLLQVDPHRERVHVLDEYYEFNKTTSEAAAEIKSRGLAPRTIRTFYPDPAEPDRTKELANLLQLKPYKRGSIDLADRIEWIRRSLKWSPLLGGPAVTFHPRCVNAIREIGDAYRYPDTAKKTLRTKNTREKPMDEDNHTPEALGRFYSGFFGRPWADAGPARQSKAKIKR